MPVPAIALYASPPSSVCSTPHPCQINAHASYDFELSSRPSSSASSTLSTSQKPVIGGISCLFSSPTVRSSSSFPGGGCGEELSSYSAEGRRRCRGKGLFLQGKRRKRTKEELKVKISPSSSSSSAFFFQCKYRREKEKEESWGDLAVMVQKTEWGHFWK